MQSLCGVLVLLHLTRNELSVGRSFLLDNQKLARQTVYVALADCILTILLQFKKKKKEEKSKFSELNKWDNLIGHTDQPKVYKNG